MALEQAAAAACEVRCDEKAVVPAPRPRRGHAYELLEQQAPSRGQPLDEASPAGISSPENLGKLAESEAHAGLPCLLLPGEHTKAGRGHEGAAYAKEAEMGFRREDGLPHFGDVHKPESLPRDPLWSLQHTTLLIDLPGTERAQDVMNRCLDFFEHCTGSALVGVAERECSFRVRLRSDGGTFLAKVKLYHDVGTRYALEVHRRSGAALAFHEMLPGLAGHLRDYLAPEVNDWALATTAGDDLPMAALASLQGSAGAAYEAALAPLFAVSRVDEVIGGGFGRDAPDTDVSSMASAAHSKSSDGLDSASRRISCSPCPPRAAAAGPAGGQPDF